MSKRQLLITHHSSLITSLLLFAWRWEALALECVAVVLFEVFGARGRQEQARTVPPLEQSLLQQIPERELQVLAWPPHQFFEVQPEDAGVFRLQAPFGIEGF